MLAKLIASIFIALLTTEAGAMVNVRISDLHNLPYPPNPVRVVGRVTAINPVTITDGKRSISAANCNGQVGHFLILEGNWNGTTLTVTREELTPEYIEIPGGSFYMGSDEPLDYDGLPNYAPKHLAYVSYFKISKYELTRGEFRKFLDSGAFECRYFWTDEGWAWKTSNNITKPFHWDAIYFDAYQTELHPVRGISYYMAEAYCKWSGTNIPTEAEWEKAARWNGLTSLGLPATVQTIQDYNNYVDSNPAGGGFGAFRSAPVGSYPNDTSPNGLVDIVGNLSECVADGYKSYTRASYPFDYSQDLKVIKGVSYYYPYEKYIGIYMDGNRLFTRYFSDRSNSHYYSLTGLRSVIR